MSERCIRKVQCPASVGDTLRVVLVSSTTRSCSSSCLTAWLTAEVETPSSRAAPVKLRRRATARKTCSCGSTAVFKREVWRVRAGTVKPSLTAYCLYCG